MHIITKSYHIHPKCTCPHLWLGLSLYLTFQGHPNSYLIVVVHCPFSYDVVYVVYFSDMFYVIQYRTGKTAGTAEKPARQTA